MVDESMHVSSQVNLAGWMTLIIYHTHYHSVNLVVNTDHGTPYDEYVMILLPATCLIKHRRRTIIPRPSRKPKGLEVQDELHLSDSRALWKILPRTHHGACI